MKTTVVNVKTAECDVYIGRAMRGRRGSVWGNPFQVGVHGTRDECIKQYRPHLKALLDANPELRLQLEALRGKRLGCWCKPRACHGDVLIEVLEGPAESVPPAPLQQPLF